MEVLLTKDGPHYQTGASRRGYKFKDRQCQNKEKDDENVQ